MLAPHGLTQSSQWESDLSIFGILHEISKSEAHCFIAAYKFSNGSTGGVTRRWRARCPLALNT